MCRIGVVIVTFRGGETVARALAALARARAELRSPAPPSVIVVDNASRDGTIERVKNHAPWAHLVELPRNVGFSAAANVGIGQLSETDVIVLLNPDVEVQPDFLRRVAALEWPATVAARGPSIFDAHGKLEQSARGFPRAQTAFLGRSSMLARLRPTSRLLQRDLLADREHGARVVDWLSGACLIIPTARFQSIGVLDPGYFMYWEDADWCHRARERSYVVIYEPSLTVTHYQGASSRSRWIATTLSFHRSAFRYWRTNVARSKASTLGAAVALTIRCALKIAGFAVRTVLALRRETVMPRSQ
jgi:N-acetylglucosaminyl-diphospho-decaprenol L-rhamnosyltransferase